MPVATAIPMKEQFASITTKQEFSYALRDFLDHFRRAPDPALLDAEPDLLASRLDDNTLADAYLASVAASLAHEHGWPAPKWAQGTERALKTPYFAAKTANLNAVLLQESPTEFRLRNIFVSANALSRA